MREKTISCRFLILGGLMPLCLLLTLIAFGCKEKTEEQTKQFVFNLDEVSVFDVGEVFRDFLRGQSTFCNRRPRRPIKYPAFKSEKPLYGSIDFAGRTAESHAPGGYHFALDESAGTGKGYDRLYFDHNCDLDLTNDTPLASMQSPPKGALLRLEQEVCFESFEVTFDYGPAARRAIEIMPRLTIIQGGYSELCLVATKVRKGQINIGGAGYYALLGYTYSVGGPFDQTGRAFYLIPKIGTQDYPRWLGANQLRAMHKIGGTYYHFSATPAGDKLFVRPYDGDFGTFEVGAGGRNMYPEMTMHGSLCSEDMVVAVGGELLHGRLTSAKSCRLPVGDYLPWSLKITFGLLRIEVSKNYHSDGKPRNRGGSSLFYGIKIRKDKPFVLDFSNKPEIMFASPSKGHRVKLGGQLRVEAHLIDPKLDIIIRRLEDITRKQKIEYVTSKGQKRTSKQVMSLEPKVLITHANGEKVAEGAMPFGRSGIHGYSWPVPTDLKLNGNEETFNVQVQYDTLELYGKVTATR
ncbi:hypothetical protein ES703_83029 [subsurface metagenome]